MHWIDKLALDHNVNKYALRSAIGIWWMRNTNDIIEREVNKHIKEIVKMVKEK